MKKPGRRTGCRRGVSIHALCDEQWESTKKTELIEDGGLIKIRFLILQPEPRATCKIRFTILRLNVTG
jgi:hypothetical protein